MSSLTMAKLIEAAALLNPIAKRKDYIVGPDSIRGLAALLGEPLAHGMKFLSGYLWFNPCRTETARSEEGVELIYAF